MSKQFDVVVIGGGPGGYIAAIRAAQLGMNVACIDEWKNAAGGPAPGGTCTNVGCIPSKALLQSSEHFEHANKHFEEHGITAKDVKIDVAKMIARKDNVVKQNNDGILYLFKKNKVTFFHGRGSFAGKADGGYEIKVAGKTEESIVGKQVIVATGSNARALPGVPFDEENVLSNDGALRLGAVPKKLALIGSGVIGLEMGSVWRRLGADVTILEGLPTFLGAVDEQIAKEAKKAFDKQGLKIELGVKVGEIKPSKSGVSVAYTNAKGEAVSLEVDKLIVSIGRVPNTVGLNHEAVGLQLDERGAIVVGSALSCLVVCSAVVACVRWSLLPGRISEISVWRIQMLTVWPAVCAVVFAVLWHTRRPEWRRLPAGHLAASICLIAYLLYGAGITLCFALQEAFHPAMQDFISADRLGASFIGGGFLTFLAIATTAIPVFLSEILVIRFVRKRWSPALAPGVSP